MKYENKMMSAVRNLLWALSSTSKCNVGLFYCILSWFLACSATENCSLKALVVATHDAGVGHKTIGVFAAMMTAKALDTNIFLESDFWNSKTSHHEIYHWMDAYIPLPLFNASKFEHHDSSPNIVKLDHSTDIFTSKEQYCGAIVKVDFAQPISCTRATEPNNFLYCNMIAGMYDQASLLLHSSFPQIGQQQHQHHHSDNSFLDVFWHLRTGDIVVELQQTSILALMRTINSYSKLRTPRHFLVTENHAQAMKHFHSIMKNFTYVHTPHMRDTIHHLFSADVMVSTGSSGSYIVPAVKTHKKLVHFFFSPKEANMGLLPVSDNDVSSNWAFQSFFIRKGVLPVNPHTGKVFASYREKGDLMMTFIDKNVDIPFSVSMMHNEKWKPWNINRSTGYYYESDWL